MEEANAEGEGGPLLELSMDTFLTVYRLVVLVSMNSIGMNS